LEADGNNIQAIEFTENWRNVVLTKKVAVMLEFTEKVTLGPSSMVQNDIEQLRKSGWGDRKILDISLIGSYYTFRTGMADGLGVELDEGIAGGKLAREIHNRKITSAHI
jgi:alkylhydroperoxidase family enzyme